MADNKIDDSPMSNEIALEELESRDKNEEDPDGRMTDLLPVPEDDFEDEAIATETEDDYSDESDADVDASDTGEDNFIELVIDVDSASNTEGAMISHFGRK